MVVFEPVVSMSAGQGEEVNENENGCDLYQRKNSEERDRAVLYEGEGRDMIDTQDQDQDQNYRDGGRHH